MIKIDVSGVTSPDEIRDKILNDRVMDASLDEVCDIVLQHLTDRPRKSVGHFFITVGADLDPKRVIRDENQDAIEVEVKFTPFVIPEAKHADMESRYKFYFDQSVQFGIGAEIDPFALFYISSSWVWRGEGNPPDNLPKDKEDFEEVITIMGLTQTELHYGAMVYFDRDPEGVIIDVEISSKIGTKEAREGADMKSPTLDVIAQGFLVGRQMERNITSMSFTVVGMIEMPEELAKALFKEDTEDDEDEEGINDLGAWPEGGSV